MPTMPQVRMPRFVVALILASLFLVSLFALRQYAAVGDGHALTLAVATGLLGLLAAASLVYANYESYHDRSNGRLNGSP